MNNISIGSDSIVADIIVFTAPIPTHPPNWYSSTRSKNHPKNQQNNRFSPQKLTG